MRVSVLSQFYPPEPTPGTISHAIACGLAKRGHQVRVITGFPNYPTGRIYPGYRQHWRQWDQVEGIEVVRLPLFPDHSRSGLRRAASYLSFAASASLIGPALSGPIDVMYVYHPPLPIGFAAWWTGLLRHAPFIYDIRDMWPETLIASGMLRPGVVASTLGHFARFVYSQAAAIVVPAPGLKRNLIGKSVPPDKIHVIPNWADEDMYYPVSSDSVLAMEHGLAGRFNVVYGGNVGLAQGLEVVVEAAERLRDLPAVQFVIIGDGVAEKGLRELVAQRRVENVRFLGRQPEDKMRYFFALADVLLVHLKRDPLFEITIPSKTLTYMACGRPILMAVRGDAADVVRDAGAGVVCEPEDPEALAHAVRQLYGMPPAGRQALGQAARKAFETRYTRRTLVARYEELLRAVAAQGRRAHRAAQGRKTGDAASHGNGGR